MSPSLGSSWVALGRAGGHELLWQAPCRAAGVQWATLRWACQPRDGSSVWLPDSAELRENLRLGLVPNEQQQGAHGLSWP